MQLTNKKSVLQCISDLIHTVKQLETKIDELETRHKQLKVTFLDSSIDEVDEHVIRLKKAIENSQIGLYNIAEQMKNYAELLK